MGIISVGIRQCAFPWMKHHLIWKLNGEKEGTGQAKRRENTLEAEVPAGSKFPSGELAYSSVQGTVS